MVFDDFFGSFRVDRGSPVPAYYQVQEWLRQRIESGELVSSSPLPPERAFVEHLGLSRLTIRQALTRLQSEGRIVRRQGSGTFVGSAPQVLVGDMSTLRGISAELADQGRSSRTRVLGAELVLPPRAVADGLGLDRVTEAIRIRRVRSVDDEPLSFETSWLHPQLCRPVLDVDLTDLSLNAVLTEQCGFELAQRHERITVTALDPFEADQLAASPGSAAFRVQRTTWDADGRPIEVVVSVLRGDRFSFEAILGRPARGGVRRVASLVQEAP